MFAICWHLALAGRIADGQSQSRHGVAVVTRPGDRTGEGGIGDFAGCSVGAGASVGAIYTVRTIRPSRDGEGEVQGRADYGEHDRRRIAGIAGGDTVDLGDRDGRDRVDQAFQAGNPAAHLGARVGRAGCR